MKRYLIEEFAIEAESKKDAIKYFKSGAVNDPVAIRVIKETIHESKK